MLITAYCKIYYCIMQEKIAFSEGFYPYQIISQITQEKLFSENQLIVDFL